MSAVSLPASPGCLSACLPVELSAGLPACCVVHSCVRASPNILHRFAPDLPLCETGGGTLFLCLLAFRRQIQRYKRLSDGVAGVRTPIPLGSAIAHLS